MKQLFFKQIEPTWRLFWKNKRLLPLALLFDLFFYFGLVKLHMEIFQLLSIKIKQVSSVMQQSFEHADPQKFLTENTQFMEQYKAIMGDVGLFLLGIFALWVVFKGLNWWIANYTSKKTKLVPYFKRFVGLSIVWMIGFLFIIFIVLSLASHATTSPVPFISLSMANNIGFFLLWLFGYFVFISYAEKGFQAFKFGWKHFRKIMPAYILTTLLAFVLSSVPITFLAKNQYATMAFVAFVALPLLAFSRLYIVEVVKKAR